ncbi:mannan endo-14-beta-mannosidase F [Pyrenophora seminiperda CCB06]|uniref:Mannan endo-14-beta-mannosidase F n=1 Tax=Pyrenophora seminiperda CCB06 TaxID=1302712 RepID=A0A3M7MIL6_9PLEO|nr:mannan endo-14-beta-mannosidase F [Pyrenophora seminiperda CCB06]
MYTLCLTSVLKDWIRSLDSDHMTVIGDECIGLASGISSLYLYVPPSACYFYLDSVLVRNVAGVG